MAHLCLLLLLVDYMPYESIEQAFLTFNKLLHKIIVTNSHGLTPAAHYLNGSQEVISAVINAPWLPAGKAVYTPLFTDDGAQQYSISEWVPEELFFFPHTHPVQVFQHCHLHL